MMKIILFSRPDIETTPEELIRLFSVLEKYSPSFMVNKEFAEMAEQKIDRKFPVEKLYTTITNKEAAESTVMLSYGGDGTFLEAVRLLAGTEIPILGINAGHLGFLATVSKDDIDGALAELSTGKYTIQKRTLLHVEGDFEQTPTLPYAFNEFSILRNEMSMASVEVFVDNEKLANYRGDGVLISTPTGSTAYSLSAGGPVVAPTCNCFVISPIAPHNLTMRPIVIPDDCEVVFKISGRAATSMVSIDNVGFTVPNRSTFKVKKGEKSIFLVNLQNISFYDTLRNKMMWGVDGRDERNK